MVTLTELPQSLSEHQLSFDVGLPGDAPAYASVKISGALGVSDDLAYNREVRVTILSLDGELISSREGKVTGIAFKKDSHGATERIHTVSI